MTENDACVLTISPPVLKPKVVTLDKWKIGNQDKLKTLALGWGKLKADGQNPNVLREVMLPIRDFKYCKKVMTAHGADVDATL